jgi:RNA polymerase sigma factor (sigma-70 family)
VIALVALGRNKASSDQVFSAHAIGGVEEIGMSRHCEHSSHGCGAGRRHALASMIVVRPSLVALDSGDTDEFSSSKADDLAFPDGFAPASKAKSLPCAEAARPVLSGGSDRGAALSERALAERFNEVVLPHLGDALALARWLTGNAADAEDVVQDACIKAHGGISGYAGGNARAWLLTIVRNTSYTWMARNRPRGLLAVGDLGDLDDMAAAHGTSAPDEDGPEASLIARADTAALEAGIAALPPPFRETLVLRDINGLSYRDISTMLGVPIGTVMSRLARARALLASELGRAS